MSLPDGEAFDGHLFGSDQPCFGCGPANPVGLHLSFKREGEEVVTHFTPRPTDQGPPGIMHGGLVSTVADELAAWTIVVQKGLFGFTTSFSCKLHQPVRIGVEFEARGRIVSDRKRVFEVEVLVRQNEALCYSSAFTFVVFDKKGAERMLQQTLPEGWERFTR